MAGANDVVVVGGGVVGTAVAYFASARGLSCTVLDKGRVGSGASHAASGVLSSSPGNGAYARLGQRSRKLYHKLAPVIREESGVDIEFAQCGELILAFDEEDVIGLQGLTHQFTALGKEAVWVSSDELLQMEPSLNPAIPGAMFTPDVCRVNNQRLSGALAGGASYHGATIRQGVEVIGLEFNDGRGDGRADDERQGSGGMRGSGRGGLDGNDGPLALRRRESERGASADGDAGEGRQSEPSAQKRKGKHHHSRLMGTSGAPERWVDDSRGGRSRRRVSTAG